jgi:hypothetical protein
MKYLFRIISLVIFFILIYSCEKENEFPKKFTQYSYLPGEIKAFTNSGEVKNSDIINSFINGFENYFWKVPVAFENVAFEIELLSEKKARIILLETRMILNSDSIINFNIIRKNGILYFQSQDTTFSHSDLTNERFRYFPLFMTTIPGSTGFQGSIYLPCIYAIEINGEIRLPFASYIERYYNSSGQLSSSQGIGNYNNVISTSYLNKIRAASFIDTFVCQDNLIVFREN